jgi:hypothetical protein
MFFRKITSRSNGKEYTYLKLIENYREGDKVKQRVIANLGSLEKLTPDKVNGLITGLSRICGVSPPSTKLETKKILRYGEVLAIHKIWELLGLEAVIASAAAVRDEEINVPLLVELMVINQIVKPQHKQAISDWYQCLYLPALEGKELSPHHFYRALDIVAENKEEMEKNIFANLNNFMPINTDLAFCRLTSGVLEPAPRNELNLTSYGKYIVGEPEQFQKIDFGLVVSRDGMPLGHKMLREMTEEWEFKNVLDYLKDVFGIDKCIFVGERNVTSNPNLEILVAHGYDYVIGRQLTTGRDWDLLARELYAGKQDFQEISEDLWFKEIREDDIRYLLCYNPIAAEQMKVFLNERLNAIEMELKAIQKAVAEKRGLKAKTFNKNAPVFKDSYCRKYFEWHYDESSMGFTYRRKDDLLLLDANLAGAFMLETNNEFLRAGEILKSYTSLNQLGKSFREIKNFEPWPNYLYAELKISANIFVCVLAAILEKTMERMIRQAGLNLDIRHALLLLEEIKVAVNQLDDREIKSITSISPIQEDIFNAIGLVKEQRTVI